MIKTLGICGEPGTGKTTLVKKLLLNEEYHQFKYGTLEYMVPKENMNAPIVLGKYDGEMFDGTDRLSMAVINDAENWLKSLYEQEYEANIIFEGDRLWCQRWVNLIINNGGQCQYKFIRLYIGTNELCNRHTQRAALGHRQTAKFILSRKTKYDNLQKEFPGLFQRRANNSEHDAKIIIDEIKLFFQTGV